MILLDNVRCRKNFVEGGLCYSTQLTIWSSNIFEHSCSPNVVIASDGGSTFGVTVRPIEKGEQLCRDLYDSMAKFSFTERRDHLMAECRIGCKCKQCITCTDIVSLPVLTLDPDFQYISIHSEFTPPNYYGLKKTTDLKTMREKTKAFLVKYGRGAWCQELVRVIQLFAGLISHTTITNKLLYEMPNLGGSGSEEEDGDES